MGILEILADEAKKEGEKLGERRGKQKLEKVQTTFVSYLLRQTDFSIAKIASLANVSTAFVSSIKKKIH